MRVSSQEHHRFPVVAQFEPSQHRDASGAEAIAVNSVFPDFIAQNTFGRVQQLSRPLAISASCLKRILNEVALVGPNCAIERKPRDGARLFGSLERWRKVM